MTRWLGYIMVAPDDDVMSGWLAKIADPAIYLRLGQRKNGKMLVKLGISNENKLILATQ